MPKLIVYFPALLLCFLSVAVADNDDDIHPPQFSTSYYTKGFLYIPSAEVAEPFEAWYDGLTNKSRVDYYLGAVKTFQFPQLDKYGTSFKITPPPSYDHRRKESCWRANGTQKSPITLQSLLPDLKGFKFMGIETLIDGQIADKWERTSTNESAPLISKFTMYLKYIRGPGKNGKRIAVPIRYDIRGTNTILKSHYDSYYFEYKLFDPSDRFESDIFDLPLDVRTCRDINDDIHGLVTLNPMREFMHGEDRHVRNAFKIFKRAHNRTYSHPEEHRRRLDTFRMNYRFIQSFNRANRTFRVGVNHFADRTPAELMTMRGLLPMDMTENATLGSVPDLDDILRNLEEPQQEFNWLVLGAVTPVKDQAMCGSCYAFATTGAIEGAYYLTCRRQIRLSEQSLIDCSWDQGNRGCGGGRIPDDYKWIMRMNRPDEERRRMGLPLDVEYGPYLAEDGSCHNVDSSQRVRIKQFYEPWRSPRFRTDKVRNLKKLLKEFGPLTVNIGPSTDRQFVFYTEGIYDGCSCSLPESVCSKTIDHSVLLVGFGRLNNKEYWLLKNSWSEKWGLNGYFLLPQYPFEDCNVSLYPTYVEISEKDCLEFE